VTWGEHRISRLLIGHNPIKGQSHFSRELDAEMREWYDPDLGHDLEDLARCEEVGINTAQFGAPKMHSIMRRHRAGGGSMQWITTLYGNEEGDLGFGEQIGTAQELAEILALDPKPIGIQHYGEKTDRLFFQGKLDILRERMKMIRDTGLLVGLGTHLPQVAARVADEDWDIDFFQTCFYTVYSKGDERIIDRRHERFDDACRDAMVAFVRQAPKPCLCFKVLGANRKCATDADVRATLEYTYGNIKPTDVVLVGMWQKYKDQIGQNARWVCEILES
jgi:hypothetical protein